MTAESSANLVPVISCGHSSASFSQPNNTECNPPTDDGVPNASVLDLDDFESCFDPSLQTFDTAQSPEPDVSHNWHTLV